MRFLVDTNVLSELVRPRPDSGVLAWAEGVSRVALSVVSLEEVYFGLAWRPNERVRSAVERFLEELCEPLPVSPEIARDAGQMRGDLRARGMTRGQADLLIAATARHHGLTLVTRNVRDFEGCGVAILDPFRGSPPS